MDTLTKLHFLATEWPPIKPKKMARDLPHLDSIQLLYVIGLFDGSLYSDLLNWLRQDGKRKLIFLEEEGSTLSYHLEKKHPCFTDPQVVVEWFPQDNREEFLSSLAEQNPMEKVEVIGPEEVRLSLLRKTTLSHAQYNDRLYGYQHFGNFIQNVPKLKGGFYVNGLRGAFSEVPAIVCGAGPSLAEAIPYLEQLEGKALIIAAGSAIAALSAAGIEPHFAVAIDPNLEEYRRFRNAFAFECPLLISTRVFPSIFTTTNGPIGYMRSGIGGATELWLEEELHLLDPLLGEKLPEESISVTLIALAIAQLFGCPKICLAGVDLAYTDGKRYAASISDESNQIEEDIRAANRIVMREDKLGKPIATAIRWIMEANAISQYALAHPEIEWINSTTGGLPIPHLKQLTLVELDLHNQFDLRGRIARLIAQNPMPDPTEKLGLLRTSLKNLIAHLEIITGKRKGSKALAELEIEEELAASILFYDIDRIAPQDNKWEFYLRHAEKYRELFL